MTTTTIEYVHASRFGNGAKVADEFSRRMAARGVAVSVHHIREVSPDRLPPADLYVFSSPGQWGKPIGRVRRFLSKVRLPAGTRYAILTTELGPPQPDKKTGRMPTDEEIATWQRVRPIMNDLLQAIGLINVAEDKVYVTRAQGAAGGRLAGDVLARPEVWGELCGWYGMDPGPLANLFDRLVFGAGVEVVVRRGQLWFRPLSAIPTMRHGFRLHPDDEDDPYVFRVDLAEVGMGTFRVAFTPPSDRGRTRHRFEAVFVSLQQRPDALNPKVWLTGGLAVGAVTLATRTGRVAGRWTRLT